VRRTSSPMMLSFPPFTRAVIWLLALNSGVFILLLLLGLVLSRGEMLWIIETFGLLPTAAVHGYVWQMVTYSVLHREFWHWFGNMLALWMFGASIETSWGPRRFLELFSFGVVGAAITTIVLSYGHILGSPDRPTIGASGGVVAILMAYGMVFGENEIMLFPIPILIKAKYFVAILVVITVIFAISGGSDVAYVAHLGGLFFGYIYVKWVYALSRSRPAMGFSERYFGLRNAYHRWRRRRAARKFEVYMRKEHHRTVNFDEHGNYIPPDDDKKNGGSKSGWVN
jgi:membrane associated rhomboid family serine protease